MKAIWLLIVLSLLSLWYGVSSANRLIKSNPAAFRLRAVGVRLDTAKTYSISNGRPQRDDSVSDDAEILIPFQRGRGIFPTELGKIQYDSASDSFRLTPAVDVADPNSPWKDKPFSAFARRAGGASADTLGCYLMSFLCKKSFFTAEFPAGESALREGVVFNTIFGDRSTRMTVRIDDFDAHRYLVTESEGLGTEYTLKDGVANKFGLDCGPPQNSRADRIFYFEQIVAEPCNLTIEVVPSGFGYSYRVLGANGEALLTGTESKPKFDAGGYLFSISRLYSWWNLAWLYLYFAVTAVFLALFLLYYRFSGSLDPVIHKTERPQKALISVWILFNCLTLLSIPLFLFAIHFTDNRWMYPVLALLFNLAFFVARYAGKVLRRVRKESLSETAPISVEEFSKGPEFAPEAVDPLEVHAVEPIPPRTKSLLDPLRSSSLYRVAVYASVGFLVMLPFLLVLFTSNERLWFIPILHLQKVATLILMFLLLGVQGKTQGAFVIRSIILLVYSAGISTLTRDLGSTVYTAFALLLVELIRRTVSWRLVAFLAILVAAVLSISYSWGNEAFEYRKAYRITAPFTSPDSERLRLVSEADRETIANMKIIQRNLFSGEVAPMERLAVPAAMRSTAFSDFAFFWSFVLGKGYFFLLFIPVLLYLVYQLCLLLFIASRAVIFNNEDTWVLPDTPESEFVRFLLAFSIVSFCYPVLSNLLLFPLTGQSLPGLSTSVFETPVFALSMVLFWVIFTNADYVKQTDVPYRFGDLLRSLRVKFAACVAIFFVALGIKYMVVINGQEAYRWQKFTEGDGAGVSDTVEPSNKDGVTRAALELIGDDRWTALSGPKRKALRNLAAFYRSGRGYDRLYFESSFFEVSTERLRESMDVATRFRRDQQLVSGSAAPFGRVYSYRVLVNGRPEIRYTDEHYNSIPDNSPSINADLTAELARDLEKHLGKIGVSANIGAILVVDNATGGIVANSSFPLVATVNTNEVHYNIGSVKKILTAYCALAIDPSYKSMVYNGRTFSEFIKFSDDGYAAALLKDLMLKHRDEFAEVLMRDFEIPLTSKFADAFFDEIPDRNAFNTPLDSKNILYRYSIGQQKPYRFIAVMEWYARIASGRRLRLNYGGVDTAFDKMSIPTNDLVSLRTAMNLVLFGTASDFRTALEANSIPLSDFIAKTGTAESESATYNSSSTLIVANGRYTVGVMLKGRIPENASRLTAKHLLAGLVPMLKRYGIFGSSPARTN